MAHPLNRLLICRIHKVVLPARLAVAVKKKKLAKKSFRGDEGFF